jgi:crotonobetainyl-CoA:carnitine CoA-transferase CaiB-like acyl-CoA transferase
MDSRALLEDPHLNGRGFWEMVTHSDAGTWKMEGPTYRLSETPAHIRMPPPCFGQHNDHVFRSLLNLTDEEIRQLADEEIVGTAPLIPDDLLLMQM